MISIRKDIISGATAQQIRDLTSGLAPAPLRELAVSLAQDPDLTISVITYDSGAQELEVLHTGLPHRTEGTVDLRKFTREPVVIPAQTMPVATGSALQDAVELIRTILWDAQHSAG